MAKDGTPPKFIRMTVHSDPSPSGKGGATPSYKTPNGGYVAWTVGSVVVFMIVSNWVFTWWMSPPIYFGMLILFLTFVMAFRMNGLQKANPPAPKVDIIKNCFESLLMVLGGYAIAVILIIVILLLTW